MIVPLQLRHCPTLAAETSAWFLPGDSVAGWLESLAHCALAGAETRLFVVPKSAEDRTPAGLLVVPAHAKAVGNPPAGLACRLLAGRLFVPVDAELHPAVSEAELQAVCALPVSFFHPVFGLSGFEAESTLRVWDLIESPEEHADHWNLARPGAPALPELRSVVLAQPPSLEDLFGGAQEDIGSESPLDLPPASDEPKQDALTKSRQALREIFVKGVAGAMRQIPHLGHQRTWVNEVEDWANRQLDRVNEQLERIRNKELHRLITLFDQDPEAALRYAIPMSSFAHRGLSPPGGRLGLRSPNFDLGQLGGRAADFWNIPPDLQEILRRRYREMADREMQLGRHRRAAYIYAQLLGDLVSAASALKRGRHYREAALLYDEHLRNPLEAARCLAEGGLLAEAIERYEKLGRWLDVADLQSRLGNNVAAESAVRRVVNERLAQDDVLGAAKLVEERLQGTDEALDLLLRAWPSSRQATGCVTAAFQMLGRLGRHEVTLEMIGRFSRETSPPLALPLLTALGGTARDYPHERVRHRAADFSRVLIARQLSQRALPTDEAGGLLQCLARLAPQDRLLARDANRYLSNRREAELRKRRVLPPPVPGNKPVIVNRFELPLQMEWLLLRNEWHWFYAVGVTLKRLTLIRGIWQGELQSLSWECPRAAVKSGLIFEPSRERGHAVVLKTLSGPDFAEKYFPAADHFFETVCVAGTPAWLKPQHWPVAFGEDTIWTAHVAGGRGIISCHNKSGVLQHTLDVTDDLLTGAQRDEQTRLCLTAVGNNAAIALGNRLVLTTSNGGITRLELPGQVIRLVATLPHTRAGLAIMLGHGAALHWVGSPGLIELDRDITAPHGAFVPGGPLVLSSDARLLLLDVDARGVQRVTRVELTGQRPIGVTATSSPGQFALLDAQGEMTVYRVPQ
ncbi:MAG: hypothetical protein U1F83_12240 [Verrucomicrobiota bacterium]